MGRPNPTNNNNGTNRTIRDEIFGFIFRPSTSRVEDLQRTPKQTHYPNPTRDTRRDNQKNIKQNEFTEMAEDVETRCLDRVKEIYQKQNGGTVTPKNNKQGGETQLTVDENILFYAFRYALGRKTYAVSIVVGCLKNNWEKLPISTQYTIKKEIMEAIKEDRAGMNIDVRQWLSVLQLKTNK